MNPEKQILYDYLSKTQLNLSTDTITTFVDAFQVEKYPRKTILEAAGKVSQHLYFVIEGVQRIYFVKNESKEATLVLTYPHSFAGIIDSLTLQMPSNYYFETLSASVLLRAHWPNLMRLQQNNPEVDALFKHFHYQAFGGILHRMVELQCFTSEEKFQALMQRSKHILNIVPHKYLANYLGIDPTNFSKMLQNIQL